MRHVIALMVMSVVLWGDPAEGSEMGNRYDVTWDSPSQDENGSMPLGNGDIALNAWIEPRGDLVFYISKTDTWDDNGRLLKVGRMRVTITPCPLGDGAAFRQTLSLSQGMMTARYGEGQDATYLRIWADANHPMVYVELDAPRPVIAAASIELWRAERCTLESIEGSDVMYDPSKPNQQHAPTVVEPDTVLKGLTDRIGWYHHNIKSVGPAMCAEIQGTADFDRTDPLLHRTFGAVVAAENGVPNESGTVLESVASKTHRFQICVLTKHPATPEAWTQAVEEACAKAEAIPFDTRRHNHEDWWRAFWGRSWIHVTSDVSAAGSPQIPRNAHPFRIGVDQDGGNRFAGEFGRVSIFNTALTDGSIRKLADGDRSAETVERSDLLYDAVPEIASAIPELTDEAFEGGATIAVWVRPGRLPGGGARLIDKITPGANDGILLDTYPGNSLRLIVGDRIAAKAGVLPVDQWSHVAAVVASGVMRLFLNGQPIAEDANGAITGSDGFVVSRAYALQRFITACAGRGHYPIKFNGSLFTVGEDYRRWGPGYWWQNTRLPYVSACMSGDFDLIQPLFRMYGKDLMPLFKYRTRQHVGHEGAYLAECIYFWGDIFSTAYGWQPCKERTDKIQESGWHKYEWVAGPELVFMMLDYYEHTLDEAFLQETLLPTAHEVLTFFERHYPSNANGVLVMHPSQACETWWECTNPMPEVAGLHAVVDRLLALDQALTTSAQRAFWAALKARLPDLPTREVDGKRMLAPAEKFAEKRNVENPELYAVFPFRLIAVGRPNLELGIEALNHRWDRGNSGWRQDDIFMAYLGLAGLTRVNLTGRARDKHAGSRFPAFWGPNYDWIPDQDHGGVLMKTLQAMLMQVDGRKVYLLPAWPKDWDVDFKLNAPYKTIIQGRVKDGKIVELGVSPESRRADIVIVDAQ